jgi:hypothetical protein
MSYVLYNAAHANTSIRSKDDKAWIRILGFFESKEAALDHASKINQRQKQEIRIAPVRSFRMIMRDKVTESLRDKETLKHSYLLSTHSKLRNYAIKKTQENAELRKMGSTSFDFQSVPPPLLPQITSKQSVSASEDLIPLLKDDEIRMQRFAAISIIPDYEVLALQSKQNEADILRAKQEYTRRKNELISKKVMEGFVLPSSEELSKSFIESFPPPPTDPTNTNFSTWLQMKNEAMETELFSRMNLEKPSVPLSTQETNLKEEPAVMFLTFSEREEEMEKTIQKIVDTDTSMKHYDIACVAMYEWLCIESLQNQSVRVKYRDSQLSKLHEARVAHSEEASTLLQNGTAKVIEI